jgi:hypothetical protein
MQGSDPNDEMPQAPPAPPPLPPPARPLEYRPPGIEPKSQWWTDDQPGGPGGVGCLLVATALGAVVATVIGVLSFFVGW